MTVEPNWAELSDDDLALRCASQLDGCMDELIRRYEKRIRDCARRMTLDRDQAEDVVQEIFLRMIVSLPNFEGRSAYGTWVYRLSHNTCIDAFRRGARDKRGRLAVDAEAELGPDDLLAALPATWGEPEAELDREIQACYLGWVLSQLPVEYREVVRLRLGEGRSTEEVAQQLGTTVDSVKAKLRRARKRLREQLATSRRCPLCGRMGPLRLAATGEVE